MWSNPFRLSLSLSVALDRADDSLLLGFQHPSLLCFSLTLLVAFSKWSFLVPYFLCLSAQGFSVWSFFYFPLKFILSCYVALNTSYMLMTA